MILTTAGLRWRIHEPRRNDATGCTKGKAVSLNGSCLCGAVRYAVDQLDMPIAHCHCTTCRKAHASALTTTAGVLREHFRWTAGEDKLRAH